MKKAVILKPGREKSVLLRHPWIFSGAIAFFPDFSDGDVLPIYSSCGDFLGQGYFHSKNSIAGRILSFDERPLREILKERLLAAKNLREAFLDKSQTNAFRLVNAEGDGLPGLIIDLYADVAVIQVSTLGMERLKPLIVQLLLETLNLRSIYEKSTSLSRLQENLPEFQGSLFGDEIAEIEIRENGLQFLVSIREGQKTGFFLDQREMRQLIKSHAKGKKVLNCFSYSGGFSLFALQGGAQKVTSVDICPKACSLCRKNTVLNGYSLDTHEICEEDVFTFLERSSFNYDVIVLDPPAFAKKRKDIDAACRGYKEINRKVFEKVPPQSLILTSSCSYFISEDLFQKILFQGARDSKRSVKILSEHRQAVDHPISLYHPEGRYLKSFLLHVE